MWEIISTLGGAFIGVVGSAVTAVFTYKNKRLEMEQVIKTKELDIELAKQEHKFALEKVSVEVEGEIQKAAEATLQASYGHDRATYWTPLQGLAEKHSWIGIPLALLFGVVDFLRGLIRPSLTIYLSALVTVMYLDATKILEADGYSQMVPDAAMIFVTEILELVKFLTIVVVSWWFGERAIHKRMAQGPR